MLLWLVHILGFTVQIPKLLGDGLTVDDLVSYACWEVGTPSA